MRHGSSPEEKIGAIIPSSPRQKNPVANEAPNESVEAAEGMAEDNREKVAAWLAAGSLGEVSATRALDLVERDPSLWAVVVSPWILIQERAV